MNPENIIIIIISGRKITQVPPLQPHAPIPSSGPLKLLGFTVLKEMTWD